MTTKVGHVVPKLQLLQMRRTLKLVLLSAITSKVFAAPQEGEKCTLTLTLPTEGKTRVVRVKSLSPRADPPLQTRYTWRRVMSRWNVNLQCLFKFYIIFSWRTWKLHSTLFNGLDILHPSVFSSSSFVWRLAARATQTLSRHIGDISLYCSIIEIPLNA